MGRKILSVCLSLVLLFGLSVLPSSALQTGQTYYIDPVSGDDTNTGTSADTAWKTLGRADDITYGAGDRILLKKGGILEGGFSAKGGGTAENPVTLGTYGDETAARPVVRSSEDGTLVSLNNVSGWCVEGIEFTAPNGRGILIRAGEGSICRNITVSDCVFHDFFYVAGGEDSNCRFPILITSSGASARLRNITIRDCNIYHCGYGIVTDGLSQEWTPELFTTPEESYNSDFLFEGLSMEDILYDGIIIMSVYGMTVRNSSFINTAMDTTRATASVWSHHADSVLIENCEMAGSANYNDGMTVDFDGWTTNSTYQYIYSHDNQRFVNNCCYDGRTRNSGCTVRYCLSVNDNKCKNSMAQIMYSGSHVYEEGEMSDYMDDFRFYNNTIINMGEMEINGLQNAVIANNIFVGTGLSYFDYAEKHIDDETGEPIYEDFGGVFTNNCFCGVAIPYVAENNYICEPGFVGTDCTDKNSFRLSSGSALLGQGITVGDDMGKTDFYGNALTGTHNIGCYDGTGEDTEAACNFFTAMKHLFMFIISNIYNLINTMNRRYWLF